MRTQLVSSLATSMIVSSLVAAPIDGGPFEVDVNTFGVITGHAAGTLVVNDGPLVTFGESCSEWWGLSFTHDGERFDYCGPGGETDWTERLVAIDKGVERVADGVLAHNVAGPVQVESRVRFEGDDLVITVTLTNTSKSAVRDIAFAREWRVESEGFDFPPDVEAPYPERQPGIARALWMPDDLRPGASGSMTFSYRAAAEARGATDPVPLVLWTSGSWPAGLDVGDTNGVCWGDYNADGWPDFYAHDSGRLWENVGGNDFSLASLLLSQIIAGSRYGAAFGDYDNDNRPDMVTAPRGCCSDLFHNLGGGFWENLTFNNAILLGDEPTGSAETICWADVDGDANLDCFVPVYPAWAGGGPGNFFLYNLGPTGPNGAYRFQEMVDAAGLDNVPPASARPEGAQFIDTDDDGDSDLYSNGHLYQNHSTPGNPLFQYMTEAASGIGLSTSLDEGAVLFDYDMDGDFDLFVVYTGPCNKIWENRGDGTFFEREAAIESPCTGLNLGMSAEDWDNDGDIDLTTRQVFRQNMLMETGEARFAVASTPSIPSSHRTSATPAWADFDKDGDLDCLLGNWQDVGHFYENTTYTSVTPNDQRRHVRVRVVRDSDDFPGGLETEFGAIVEIRVAGEDGIRRRKFTSSANGYLNQNEYTLTFALPADPTPGDPNTDLTFDVVVNFPTVGGEVRRQVDKHVNAALGGLSLADLPLDREINVYRSGQVEIGGEFIAPTDGETADLYEAGGGLRRPGTVNAMPGLFNAASGPWIGLEFDTINRDGPTRVKEIVFDGHPADPADCDPDTFNMALYDVTDGGAVRLQSWTLPTASENARQHIPVDLTLEEGRSFRLIARVTSYRPTDFAGPVTELTGLTTSGALFFFSNFGQQTCPDAAVASAGATPDTLYMSINYAPASTSCVPDFAPPAGVLDFFDVQAFLAAFAAMDPAADLTDDGAFDFFDVQAFLSAFSAGCP